MPTRKDKNAPLPLASPPPPPPQPLRRSTLHGTPPPPSSPRPSIPYQAAGLLLRPHQATGLLLHPQICRLLFLLLRPHQAAGLLLRPQIRRLLFVLLRPHPAVGLLLRPHPSANSLEWEVLLAANSLENLVVDDDDGGVETYFLGDADDVLFGQLAAEAEHEPPAKGGRPAANAAVEGLPTVVVTEADAARGDAQCAVCKEGIEAGEGARRLPCAHLYHDACILPWLAIRNTCPLCRHELPTDDLEYEKWKARRAGGGGNADANGDSDRYDVIRLP